MLKTMLKKFILSMLLTAVVISMFPARAFAAETISENLLKNPSFEEYVESKTFLEKSLVKVPADWIDPLESWALSYGRGPVYPDALPGWGDTNTYGWHGPVDGKYFICLMGNYYKNNGANKDDYWKDFGKAEIYQDVDLQKYGTDTIFKLSGHISGSYRAPINEYDDYGDNDRGIMYLNFLDASDKILASKSVATREFNPGNLEIQLSKPEGAVKARIVLKAIRALGGSPRNQVWFDDIDFRAVQGTYREIKISGKTDAKPGETVQLSVNNGISQNPSDFTWWSEHKKWAAVDRDGKVTLGETALLDSTPKINYTLIRNVIVYAKDSDGNVGSFTFGAGYIGKLKEILEENNTNTNNSGTQTPNTDTGKKIKTISGVKVTKKSNEARLTWNKYKGADFYLVHRYNKSKKKWDIVGRLMKKQRTCELKGLKKNVEYRFKVTAEKRTGKGSNTLAVSKIIKVKLK